MDTVNSKSGKVIYLRPVQVSDTQMMLNYINELGREDIYLNVNPDDLYTYEQEESFVRDCVTRIRYKQMVYYLAFDGNKLIGSCSVAKQDKRRKHRGLLGVTLHREYRADGIGTKLVEFTINKAIDGLGISMVVLTVFADNLSARNLYGKLGFVKYGCLSEGVSYKGKYLEEVLMYKKLT